MTADGRDRADKLPALPVPGAHSVPRRFVTARLRRARPIVCAGAGAALLLVTASSPALRESLVALEPAWPPLLFCTAFAGALAYRLARAGRAVGPRRALLRLEGRVSRLGARLGWAAAVVLFLVPLWAHWDLRPPGLVPAYAALWGDIPFADAHGHLEGATRLLADGSLNGFSERRPLSAAWLAVRLAATGGLLRAALVLNALVAAFAAVALARAVALRWGMWAALGTFAALLGLSRDFLPTVLTESIGITLGSVAAAILVSRPSRTRLSLAGLGLFFVSLALSARPGAQLLLPALVCWLVLAWRTPRAVAVAAAAAVGGLAVSGLLNAAYGSGEASAASYPAFTFYGLTRNSNDRQVARDFPNEDAGLTESMMARRLYSRALDNLLTDPRPFFTALRTNAAKCMRKTPANFMRLASLRPLFAPNRRPRGALVDAPADRKVGGPIVLTALLMTVSALRGSAVRGERSLWLATVVGVLASVPFVYGDSGFRVLAATYPFLAVLLAAGFATRRERRSGRARTQAQERLARAAAIGGLALLTVILIGPGIARAVIANAPALDPRSIGAVPPHTVLAIEPSRAVAIVVSNTGSEGAGRPVLDRRDFSRALETVPVAAADYFDRLRPPFCVLSAYDRVARRQRLLVGPVDLVRTRERFLRLEVHPAVERDPGMAPGSQDFLAVERWTPLPVR